MNKLALIAAIVTLAGCANNAGQGGSMRQTWIPNGPTQKTEAQALAKCRYDILQNPNNFSNLSKLAGQAGVAPDGRVRGLSPTGSSLFVMCMNAEGFAVGPQVPDSPTT
jgi:hypothetical protein